MTAEASLTILAQVIVSGVLLGAVYALLTFGLGTALAAAAGSLLAIMYTVYPEMGRTFLLKAFAIIVLGGLGSFGGAFLGALALGVAEALASFAWTAQIAEAVAYVLLIAVLLARPSGLFGIR